MLGGIQNLYGLWNCFNFSNQADEYIFFSSYMGRDIIVVVVDYQFHNLNNTAVMCTSYSQVKNMQNLKNKRGSFTAFNNINILFWMPSSAVSNETKPRQYQNQNTLLALRYQPWSLIQGSWYDEANANASHKLKHLADICSFLDIQKTKESMMGVWKPRAGFCWQPVINFKISSTESWHSGIPECTVWNLPWEIFFSCVAYYCNSKRA